MRRQSTRKRKQTEFYVPGEIGFLMKKFYKDKDMEEDAILTELLGNDEDVPLYALPEDEQEEEKEYIDLANVDRYDQEDEDDDIYTAEHSSSYEYDSEETITYSYSSDPDSDSEEASFTDEEL